jgi:putative intracellular protease/amidase
MKVAYVVYPDFTALDLIGPYEVISRWPDVEIHFLASQSGACHNRLRSNRCPHRHPRDAA